MSLTEREPAESQPAETWADMTACWHCGSAEYEPLFRAADFDTATRSFSVVRCRQCGLDYTAGVSEEVLAAAYSTAYYGSSKAKFLSVIETLVRAGHRRQASKIIDIYRAGRPDSRAKLSVLDIGCGRGLLLRSFGKLGAQCLGIERDEFPGSESATIEMHIGALQDDELANRNFDIIVIWHVLEHVTALASLLEELPRHLSSGGLLVVSVPNFSSWQGRFFKQHWFHLDIPRHVVHFEASWLRNKLVSMGLEIQAQTTFSASQNMYGFVQSWLNRMFPKKPNRLYQLLTRNGECRNWTALIGWLLLALPLIPLAVLEALLSEFSNRGATLTLYARKRADAPGSDPTS